MKESYRTFEYNITGVQRQKLKQKTLEKKYTLTPTPTPAPRLATTLQKFA